MKKKNNKLSHVDKKGRPAMVDISGKQATIRTAEAVAVMVVSPEIASLFDDGEIHSKKGPVLHTAIIAGTQAVKETSRIIPFCHPLPIQKCAFSINVKGRELQITCQVSAEYKTGVEMEALTGASVAALTIYDMCKAVSHDMEIKQIRVTKKTGGKSDIRS